MAVTSAPEAEGRPIPRVGQAWWCEHDGNRELLYNQSIELLDMGDSMPAAGVVWC